MKNTKRGLSILLSLALLITSVGVGLGTGSFKSELPSAETVGKTAVSTAVTFYVPELIYLTPSSGTANTFKYYVDSNTSGTLDTTKSKTSGVVYFNCANATAVSISCSGASVTLGSTSSSSATLNTTVTGGTLSTGLSQKAVSTLTWTASYTVNGESKTAKAFTVCYAPPVEAIGVAQRLYNSDGTGGGYKADLQGWFYVSGVQGYGTGGIRSFNQTSGKVVCPMLGTVTAPPGNTTFSDYITGSSGGVYYGDWSGGDDTYALNKVSPTGILTVDTSRYNNINQIPNFTCGMAITHTNNMDDLWYYMSDYDDVTNYTGDYQGSDSKGVFNNNTGNIFFGDVNTKRTVTQSIIYGGQTGGNVYSNAISGNGTYNMKFKGAASANNDGETNTFACVVPVTVTKVDKGALRTAVRTHTNYALQAADYSGDSTDFTAYQAALKSAAESLGNPTSSPIATTALTNAYNALTKDTYTATINHKFNNGEATIVETQNFDSGDTVTFAPDSYTGYTLTSADGHTSSTSAQTVYNRRAAITQNYNYTANKYTVTFNANGGSAPSPANKEVTYDSTYGNLATTSRVGYTFNGWYTAPTGGTKVESTTAVTTTSNQTLYAQWTAGNYTVTFDANGGSTPSPTGKQVTYGSAYGTLATTSRVGYSFNGWYTAQTGGTKVESTTTVTTTSNHTLYAQWTAGEYTVTFDANGGGAPSPANKQVTYDSTYGTLATTLRAGYTFNGWYTATTGGTKVESTTSVTTASNHTLYAQWTAGEYTVTFDANGGGAPSPTGKQVTYGSTYGTLATTSRTGYTFNGWYTASTGGTKVESTTTVTTTSNHTLYAQWTAVNYTVTFDANGGGAPSPANKQVAYDSTYGSLATTSLTGYTFNGWYTASTGGTKVESTTTVTTASDHTLYAQWTLNNYNITFNANGGTGGWGPTAMAYGAPLTAPTVTRTGYSFKQWTPAVPSTVPAADAIYNAVWTINKYTVSFNSNGGSAVAPITQDYNSSVAKPTPDPTKTNFTFAGWYSDAGLTNAVTWSYTLGAANVTFYAKWTGNAHTITFDANGGSGGWSNTMNFGDTLTPPTVTRSGYAFTGWQPSPPPTVGGTATYTAQWDETIVGATLVNDDLVINIVGWAADYSYQIWTYQQITSDTLLDDTSGVQVNQWILSQPYTLGSAGASGAGASINFTIDGTFTSPNKNYTIAVRIVDENGDYLCEMRDSYTPTSVDESEITKVLVDGEYVRGSSQEDIDKNIKSTVLKEITPSAAPVIKVIGNLSGMTYTAMVVETSQVLTANGNEFAWDISGYIPQRYTVRVTASNGTSTDTLDILFMLYSSSASVQYGNMNSLSLTNGALPLKVPQVIGINTNFSNGNFHYVVREMGRAAIFTSQPYQTSGNIPHNIEKYGTYHVYGYANRTTINPSEGNYDDGIIKPIVIKRSNSPSSMTVVATPSFANPIAKGTAITITANASIAGIGVTPVEYSFYRYDAKGYVLIKDWSSDNTLAWTPGRVGEYTIQVRAKGDDAGSYEVLKTVEVRITDPNELIAQGVVIELNETELDNAQARTPITIKASATNANDDALLYRFFVYDDAMLTKQLQAYSPNQECIWTPRKAGTYKILVQVKNEVSFGKYDATKSFEVTVN